MTLIVLLITILLAYFVYCHRDNDISRDDNALRTTSIDIIDQEKVFKSNTEVFKAIEKTIFLISFSWCSKHFLFQKFNSLLVSTATLGSDPCPSTSSDTTCTSIQSDSSQSSASSSSSYYKKWKWKCSILYEERKSNLLLYFILVLQCTMGICAASFEKFKVEARSEVSASKLRQNWGI